jgi:hypothetical protein
MQVGGAGTVSGPSVILAERILQWRETVRQRTHCAVVDAHSPRLGHRYCIEFARIELDLAALVGKT